jgi:plasmid stabilization system protein ParE
MADYILSTRAALDIEDIVDYGLTNFGVSKSREYGQGLEVCLDQLAVSPLMGLGADEIFYVQRIGGIRVVRVLQKNMDFVRHL